QAQLAAALLSAYLSDQQAQRDAQDMTRVASDDAKTVQTIDEFTDKVNSQRTSNALSAIAQVSGAVMQTMSTIQQAQINVELTKTGGRVTPQIQQMQANKAMTD